MILHTMNLVQKAANHVNKGKIPVITADQPLFAIAKLIQWRLKEYVSKTTFHHEQTTGVQEKLAKNVKQLTSVIHEMGTHLQRKTIIYLHWTLKKL